MRKSVLAAAVLTVASGVLPGLGLITSAHAETPGGVFITGHDPDYHAHLGGNTTGARNIIQRGIQYVTNGAASPTVLLVTSRMAPPGGHIDSALGLTAAGYSFDMASAGGAEGVLDVATVPFTNYDVVVVASDFGGNLRQAELDILNSRSADVISYINGGGGLVAFAESNNGAHLTPTGGHFDYLPFVASESPLDQAEVGHTVTAFGAALGLTDSDVNGNVSHNVFTTSGGMNVVDVDAANRILTLATRGVCVSPGGVPAASVDDVSVIEGDGGVTLATFTVSLSVAPVCESVSVVIATADQTASAPSDYAANGGTLIFPIGTTSQTFTVTVNNDNVFEADETFLVNLGNPNGVNIADAQGVGTIINDDAANDAPNCSNVAPSEFELWPPNHTLREVSLGGATDPDGDPLTYTITGVSQDEPVSGEGDGTTAPDATAGFTSNAVQLRAERSGRGDGRIYRIAYTVSDSSGETCSGTTFVSVPHSQNGSAAVDSGGSYNSFAD